MEWVRLRRAGRELYAGGPGRLVGSDWDVDPISWMPTKDITMRNLQSTGIAARPSPEH